MEKYYAKRSVQNVYKVIGVVALGFSLFVIILNPYKKLGLGPSTQFVLYSLTLFVSILHFLRPNRSYLELKENEIFFHDGLLGRTVIRYDLIKSVDYHQDLKFRMILKKPKGRKVQIPNIFTVHDQEKIVESLKKRKKTIKINYLKKPEKYFRINKTKRTK